MTEFRRPQQDAFEDSIYCPECGAELKTKYFSLNDAIYKFFNTGDNDDFLECLAYILKILRIGAEFREAVLPDVSPLFKDNILQIPDPKSLMETSCNIKVIEKKENQDNALKLTPVHMTISSIVAQFCRSSDFYDFYTMLQLRSTMLAKPADKAAFKAGLDRLIEKFRSLPTVSLGAGTEDVRYKAVEKLLDLIIQLAKQEADGDSASVKKHPGAAWRYVKINGREMPEALLLRDGTRNLDIRCCRCPSCMVQLPYEMGAYPQRIIGFLGTQSAGKTTYLVSLVDSILQGDLTRIRRSGADDLRTDFQITHDFQDDVHWARFQKGPVITAPDTAAPSDSGEDRDSSTQNKQADVTAPAENSLDPVGGIHDTVGKIGALWLYKRGFPPEKTDVGEINALSFLVSPKGRDQVMYTLADIPGEAFDNATSHRFSPVVLEAQHRLLEHCHALVLVISPRQFLPSSGAEHSKSLSNMETNPQNILTCYEHFLPRAVVPTAVVMTAADEINGGNLSQALRVSYKTTQDCQPLAPHHGLDALVYNVEPMHCISKAVKEYINCHFGALMEAVLDYLERVPEKRTPFAAFAVSNGTQYAPCYYTDVPAEKKADYCSTAQMNQRYRQICAGRYGIAAPLLWLLACDGILDVGQPDTQFNRYPPKTQKIIHSILMDMLYR